MPTDPRRGVILVAVLWTVALLSALAMATSVTFREFAGIVTIDRDRLRAEALLTAGIETAAGLMIRWPDDRPLYESEMTIRLSTGQVRARVSDETGRVDIGKAPVEVLTSMLRHVGAGNPDGIARAIVDWRIANGGAPPQASNPQSPPGQPAQNTGGAATPPAQNQQQQTAAANQPKPPGQGAATPPKGMPFTDIRQLLNVPGVTPSVVAAATPYITVFGGDKVNALTATAQVLAILPGMDEDRVANFLQARRNIKAADQLIPTLGAAQRFVFAGGNRKIASVVVQSRTTDGYSAAGQAVIILSPQGSQPYRVLVWNPWPAALSKW